MTNETPSPAVEPSSKVRVTQLALPSRSAAVGGGLVLSLWLGLLVSIIVASGRALELLLPERTGGEINWLPGLEWVLIAISVVSAILLLIWVDFLHQDLQEVYPHYPMSAEKARWMIWTPVVNLVGMFLLFRTLGNYLHTQNPVFGSFEKAVWTWIPIVVLVLLGAGSWVVANWPLNEVDPGQYVVGLAIVPVLYSLGLGMSVNVRRAVAHGFQLHRREVTL